MNPEEKNKCQRKEVAERNIKEIATERKRVKEDSDEGVASDEDESYNVDHLQVKNEIGLEGDVGDKRAPSTTRTTSSEFEFVPGERQKTEIGPVLEALLENIRQNNAELTDVNLNNKENVSTETLVVFAQALCNNTAVSCWSLANTRADDRVALAVAAMLRQNKGLRTLNVESNFIGGRGIIAIVSALRYNDTLIELRFHNQRHILGGRVEMDMARLLRDNSTLLRLGYHFELAGPRMTTASLLSRNLDRQRQVEGVYSKHTNGETRLSLNLHGFHNFCDVHAQTEQNESHSFQLD
uniref:Leiomodin-3 n=1 Tax=Eptatretus burgeri TaxID=7764 RepID=A0A8C4QWN4_EPTBU